MYGMIRPPVSAERPNHLSTGNCSTGVGRRHIGKKKKKKGGREREEEVEIKGKWKLKGKRREAIQLIIQCPSSENHSGMLVTVLHDALFRLHTPSRVIKSFTG
jgi:hypothetical protein